MTSIQLPSIMFRLELPQKARECLVWGNLTIKTKRGEAGTLIEATSGLASYQYEHSWIIKGRGCIPPSAAIRPLMWTVSTQRLWMPHVRGVSGSFYSIAPFSVGLGATSRGDFGIHHDANMPGSAGCIVIRNQIHWNFYRAAMDDFQKRKIQAVPLEVEYIY